MAHEQLVRVSTIRVPYIQDNQEVRHLHDHNFDSHTIYQRRATNGPALAYAISQHQERRPSPFVLCPARPLRVTFFSVAAAAFVCFSRSGSDQKFSCSLQKFVRAPLLTSSHAQLFRPTERLASPRAHFRLPSQLFRPSQIRVKCRVRDGQSWAFPQRTERNFQSSALALTGALRAPVYSPATHACPIPRIPEDSSREDSMIAFSFFGTSLPLDIFRSLILLFSERLTGLYSPKTNHGTGTVVEGREMAGQACETTEGSQLDERRVLRVACHASLLEIDNSRRPQ
jgi:hypothetical protein